MNFDTKNIIIFLLLLIIVIMLIQMRSYKTKDLEKENAYQKPTPKVEFKVDDSISNRKKPNTKILPDFAALDKEFYLNLKNCTPVELATETELEYSIYGYVDNKCSFQHREDFYVLDCKLPADITEKYAEDGLKGVYELETLKAQNKTGFVHAGEYITDINNNSGYCKSYSTNKMK